MPNYCHDCGHYRNLNAFLQCVRCASAWATRKCVSR
jgi:hypothetical protein